MSPERIKDSHLFCCVDAEQLSSILPQPAVRLPYCGLWLSQNATLTRRWIARLTFSLTNLAQLLAL